MKKRSLQIKITGDFSSPRWRVLLIASLGAFLMPVDNSMLFIAVPQIARGLGEDPARITWVPTASLIGVTAFSIPLGRLSDIWGRKKLYLTGLVLAGMAALAAGLARNVYELVVIRLITGASAGLIAANAWALISEAFPAEQRGKALGINTAFGFTGLSLGPVIGGLLITQFGTWRAPFYALLGAYLILAVFSVKWLPVAPAPGSARSIDLPGSLSFIGGLVLLMLGLSLGRTSGWKTPPTLAALICGVGMLGLFVRLELRTTKDPMLDLRAFRKNTSFTLGGFATLLHYMSAHQSVSVLISFYVQWAINRTAAVAGVIILAKFLTMAIFSPFSGWLSDKVGARWLCSLGMAFVCAGLVLLAAAGPAAGLTDVFLRLSLVGVGIGLFASPNISAVLGSLPRDMLGTASGVMSTGRSLGGALGLVLAGSILAGGPAGTGFAGQIRAAFFALALVGLLGIVVSASRGKSVPDERPDSQG